jgi:hypothetical protein
MCTNLLILPLLLIHFSPLIHIKKTLILFFFSLPLSETFPFSLLQCHLKMGLKTGDSKDVQQNLHPLSSEQAYKTSHLYSRTTWTNSYCYQALLGCKKVSPYRDTTFVRPWPTITERTVGKIFTKCGIKSSLKHYRPKSAYKQPYFT